MIEEALLTAKAGKPLYLSGALGGAAKAMADALLRRRLSDEARAMFFTPPAIAGLLSAHSAAFPVPPEEGPSSEEGWNALDDLQAIPLAQLGAKSGLTEEEYVQLLDFHRRPACPGAGDSGHQPSARERVVSCLNAVEVSRQGDFGSGGPERGGTVAGAASYAASLAPLRIRFSSGTHAPQPVPHGRRA